MLKIEPSRSRSVGRDCVVAAIVAVNCPTRCLYLHFAQSGGQLLFTLVSLLYDRY